MQHKLPTFDKVLQRHYFEPNFIASIQNCFFATINTAYFSISKNIDNVIEFTTEFPLPFKIKEDDSEDHALAYLNRELFMYVMPRSAYIRGDIQYIRQVFLNTVDSFQAFIAWFLFVGGKIFLRSIFGTSPFQKNLMCDAAKFTRLASRNFSCKPIVAHGTKIFGARQSFSVEFDAASFGNGNTFGLSLPNASLVENFSVVSAEVVNAFDDKHRISFEPA